MTTREEQRKIVSEAIGAVLKPGNGEHDEGLIAKVLKDLGITTEGLRVEVCPEGVKVHCILGFFVELRPRDMGYKS